MPVQTTFIETNCLECGAALKTDMKSGGNRYCFCPDCNHWSVFNHPAINEQMRQVELKRYGYDRTRANLAPAVEQIVNETLDEIEAEAEAELAEDANAPV